MTPQSAPKANLVSPKEPTKSKEADKAIPGSETNTAGQESESKSEHSAEENQHKTSWIEIEMVYESNGLPVAGVAYEITLPDGKVKSGTTDERGFARVDHIDPGSCQVSFPDLDKDAWEDA